MRRRDRRPRILQEVLPMYRNDERYPDRIRVSFEDGTTRTYGKDKRNRIRMYDELKKRETEQTSLAPATIEDGRKYGGYYEIGESDVLEDIEEKERRKARYALWMYLVSDTRKNR